YEKRRLTMNNISLATQTFGTTNWEYYIGTIPQTEPIEVSQDMFNQLMSWYTGDRYERTFCEFIHESDVHLFEKLSFLQKYVFDNEDFTDADTSTEITNW